jgi:hypothetical protein
MLKVLRGLTARIKPRYNTSNTGRNALFTLSLGN